jgi:hypothetical protein
MNVSYQSPTCIEIGFLIAEAFYGGGTFTSLTQTLPFKCSVQAVTELAKLNHRFKATPRELPVHQVPKANKL